MTSALMSVHFPTTQRQRLKHTLIPKRRFRVGLLFLSLLRLSLVSGFYWIGIFHFIEFERSVLPRG